MNNNVKENFIALKSLMKEIEKDLKEQLKVEDKVPEDKTNSMKDLLEFTKDEMKKRPSTSKPGKVEKGKKSSKKHIKKSVMELKALIEEISVMKANDGSPGQSPDARFGPSEAGTDPSRIEDVRAAEEAGSEGPTGEGSTGAGSTGQSTDTPTQEPEDDIKNPF
jgi:hypothetical protein